MSIRNLFSKYIKNSEYKGNIIIQRVFVCTPRKEIQKVINNKPTIQKIFIGTRSLKHIYDRHIFDKKTPRDFYFILINFRQILNNVDRIYKDTQDKRGNYIFVRIINKRFYMCTIEIISDTEIEIVSASVTGEKYLSKFTLLWSWGTANSPS